MTTRGALTAALALLVGCAGAGVRADAPRAPAAGLSLVESEPLETTLDRPDLPDAWQVWPAMIAQARRTIDLNEFYASEAEGDELPGSRLTAVIEALESAVRRGVTVRLLLDATFSAKYPALVQRFSSSGVVVRTIDVGKLSGGVLHAKYFVVDGEESFIGSQNFDWRALGHIQEMGVRVASTELASALGDVFETDWALAAGAEAVTRVNRHPLATPLPVAGGGTITLVASPRGYLPDERSWDLPALVQLLDGARGAIALQVLTYRTRSRSGEPFTVLDDALRRAAGRGVRVRLLVSEWAEKPGSDGRAALDALAAVPNVEVRVLAIPRFSVKDIPFARVAHAKYLVVDGRTPGASAAWVGTSNWEGDYFERTRNVGVVVRQGAVPARLARFFEENWSSRYARPPVTPANATDGAPVAAPAPPASNGPARP